RSPGPGHERLFGVMFDELSGAALSIAALVGERTAQLAACHAHTGRALPRHRQRREAPALGAWHTGGIGIDVVMAQRPLRRGGTVTMGATHNLVQVAMAVVALTRVVGAGVAVQASRMREHGFDLPPLRETIVARRRGERRSDHRQHPRRGKQQAAHALPPAASFAALWIAARTREYVPHL